MEFLNNKQPIPRMRTVKEAAAEIKQLDAHTAMTEWRIRELALSGVLPRVQAGKKLLINLDTLFEYLENPTAISGGGMRVFGRTVEQEEADARQNRFLWAMGAVFALWLAPRTI